MIDRLLAAVFGKRHREGWPRGVVPVAPWIDQMRAIDPEWFNLNAHKLPSEAFAAFFERNPEMKIADPE